MVEVGAAFFLVVLAKCVGLAALVAAAADDLRRRIIPNEAVLIVAGAGLSLRLLDFHGAALAISGAVALGLLIALGQMARFDMVGGGDAKLIAAVSLSQPPDVVLALLLYIALAGVVVALVYLARGGLHFRSLCKAVRSQSVPYGVAILLGTLSLNIFEVSRSCVAAQSCWF